MTSSHVRSSTLAIVGILCLMNSDRVFAGGRRAAHGTPPRHCHFQPTTGFIPQTPAYPVPTQGAVIPPALVPIVMTVGQDVASIALQRLIDQLRGRLGDVVPPQNPESPYSPEIVTNPDLKSLDDKLVAIEKKIGITTPTPTPENNQIKKGSIPIPEGPPAKFPRLYGP